VLTNAHVVGNVRAVEVRLADGRTIAGQVLGRDPSIEQVIATGRVVRAFLGIQWAIPCG
jgi:S1-C subfamily serine protease